MRKSRKRAITGFGGTLLVLLAFAIYFHLTFTTVVVSGESMLPTLTNGQRVLTSRAYWLVGPIRDKDVVVIKDDGPTGYIIKRVYKMAGEIVDWYNVPDNVDFRDGEYKVPLGHVYVLGDNREVSEDSRRFGPVKVDDIIGKVVIRQ
ncbi:MAG: signal peptidase I [Armatimonadetes bacterium 55-13]|nr:signal peptidase I [Armatimonadota bacterium]OJU65372.1 MAG: signal peptidase I [Armatimonadetes bacterium 55-13]